MPQNITHRLEIIKAKGTDGVTRWIVQIPSTKSWDPSAGSMLNDVTADLEEMGGQSSQLEAAVREAMRQAHIPAGADVMLTGFSLGGITAGHLASDPSFTSTYNVQAVLTGGSPIARFDIGSTTQVLSLEHTDDIVPHLDGMSNPDQPNWTTYTDATPVIKDAHGNDVPAHNYVTYAQTAAEAQASGDPSVDYYTNTVRPYLDGTQTIQDYQAERVP